MEILGTTLRICVEDLEAAVPFYERLAGSRAMRHQQGGVSVAAVGCFLLMSGPKADLDVLRKVAATIAVADVEQTGQVLAASGAAVIAGPVVTPAGRTLVAMHPDGSVFEYADRLGASA
ncbi:VOC family protein [Streptomyces koyangensis]|uniref:VOC family protein n=1 Tax=Streptomyces koyangensis TaxID=188770 RepID=UPI003C2FA4FA